MCFTSSSPVSPNTHSFWPRYTQNIVSVFVAFLLFFFFSLSLSNQQTQTDRITKRHANRRTNTETHRNKQTDRPDSVVGLSDRHTRKKKSQTFSFNFKLPLKQTASQIKWQRIFPSPLVIRIIPYLPVSSLPYIL